MALFKMAMQCEKSCEIKSCEIKGGSQGMAVMVLVDGNNFNNNNSDQFVLPHPSLTIKFTGIVVIKVFTISLYHHSHFLLFLSRPL